MANTISDKLTYLEGTKSAIKDAIVAKGVAVSDSDTFRSYADKIGQISGGGGGKINLNDYGLTFAHSSPTDNQVNQIIFDLPDFTSTRNFFSHMQSPNAYINLFSMWNTGLNYDCSGMLSNAKINQIDFPQEITIRDGNNMFSSFNANALTLDTIILQTNTAWYDLSQMFNSSNVVCNHIIIRDEKNDTPYVVFNTAFANLTSTITTLPDIKFELVGSSINLECGGTYSYLPDTITTLPEWDLTGVNEGQSFNNWPFYSWESPNTSITDMEGIINLRVELNLSLLQSLNSAAIDNILNKAADLTGEVSQTITFAADVYNALTEEQKSLATSKNWTLASA